MGTAKRKADVVIMQFSDYPERVRKSLAQFFLEIEWRNICEDEKQVQIILDEFQNADDTTLTTVCTRLGNDSRLIICGDTVSQNDMGNKSGGDQLLSTLKKIDEVSIINFKPSDCVRSKFVKDFLIAKYC